MEKLPIFNFSQWVVANGGTVRILDDEFEPVDNIPGGSGNMNTGSFQILKFTKKMVWRRLFNGIQKPEGSITMKNDL